MKVVGITSGGFFRTVEQDVDLGGTEAGRLDFEIFSDQEFELVFEECRVPTRQLGELVVGDDISAFLGLGQAGNDAGRDGRKFKCFSRLNAAVSAQNNPRFIDQNRSGETEFLDTGLELGQLLVVVDAGVSGPRFEISGPAINKAACDVGFKYFGFFSFHRKAPGISRF